MLPPIFARFETRTRHIAAQFQPSAVAELDGRASELGRNIDAGDVHADADRFNVDAVMALEVAEHGVVADVAHHTPLPRQLSATAQDA